MVDDLPFRRPGLAAVARFPAGDPGRARRAVVGSRRMVDGQDAAILEGDERRSEAVRMLGRRADVGDARTQPDAPSGRLGADGGCQSQDDEQDENGCMPIHGVPLEEARRVWGITGHEVLRYARPATTALAAAG